MFYVPPACVYKSSPAIYTFMFYLPIHTMLVVMFVIGLGKGFYTYCTVLNISKLKN